MKAIKKLKTIRSYQGLAQFLAGCSDKMQEVPKIQGLPTSRYSYSPTSMVEFTGEGIPFVRIETARKVYEIWQVGV